MIHYNILNYLMCVVDVNTHSGQIWGDSNHNVDKTSGKQFDQMIFVDSVLSLKVGVAPGLWG